MDINNLNGNNGADEAVELTKALGAAESYAKSNKTAAKDVSKAADSSELSAKALELNEVRKVLDNIPEIRENKVAQLKKAIADGSFDPSGSEIADSFSDEFIEELLKE